MISDKHKFIFVHVPKSGGTYITNHLFPFSEDCRNNVYGKKTPHSIMPRRPCEKFHAQFGVQYMHASAQELSNYMGKEKFKEYFSFACVRNPYDRLVSVHFWGSAEGRPEFGMGELTRLNTTPDITVRRTHPHMTGAWATSLSPLQYFLLDDSGEMLVDYCFDLKTLNSSLQKVAARTIGSSLQLDSEKHNTSAQCRSPHKHYSHYYTQEMKEWVEEHYGWEINYFNFKFEDKC